MCFSANASFIASGLLTAVGLVSWSLVRHKSQRAFAAIPFLFALQQSLEGILWLLPSSHDSMLTTLLMYSYLLFALGIWPFFIPYALMQLDGGRHKKIFTALCAIGVLIACYLLLSLLVFGATVDHGNGHMHYQYALLGGSYVYTISPGVYVLLITVPFFVTPITILRFFGGVLFVAAAVSFFVWYTFYTSVWCFFAAVISGMTCVVLKIINGNISDEKLNNKSV